MYLNKCKVPSREDNDNNLTVSHINIRNTEGEV